MRISMILELQRKLEDDGLCDFAATYRESLEQARLADERRVRLGQLLESFGLLRDDLAAHQQGEGQSDRQH